MDGLDVSAVTEAINRYVFENFIAVVGDTSLFG
jgi:hypothetical protein